MLREHAGTPTWCGTLKEYADVRPRADPVRGTSRTGCRLGHRRHARGPPARQPRGHRGRDSGRTSAPRSSSNIRYRRSGKPTNTATIMATVRDLKFDGGIQVADLGAQDLGAIEVRDRRPSPAPRQPARGTRRPCTPSRYGPASRTDTTIEVAKIVEFVDVRERGHRSRRHASATDRSQFRRLSRRTSSQRSTSHSPVLVLVHLQGRFSLSPRRSRPSRTRVYGPSQVTSNAEAGRRLLGFKHGTGPSWLPVSLSEDTVLVLRHRSDPARRSDGPLISHPRGPAVGRGPASSSWSAAT